MRFRDFLLTPLTEGGNAIKGAAKITQAEIREVVPVLAQKIQAALKLSPNKVKLIGSGGKKPNDSDLSNDIDFAVECDTEVVAEHLKDLAGDHASRAMKGIGVYSFAHEVGNKLVQVDLIPVSNIKFAEWSYQANPDDLRQGLKGAQRNELYFAIAKYMPQELLKNDDQGKPLEIKRYFYDLSRGLMIGTKSRVNKNGKVGKNFSTVDKKVISDDPTNICEKMFGKGVTPEQVSTFDGTLRAISSPKFLHRECLNDILELAKDGIKNKNLKLPSVFLDSK